MKFNRRWLWLIIPLIIFSLVWINSSSVSTVLLAIKGTITDGNLIKFSGTVGVGEDAGIASTDVSDAVAKKHSQNTDTGTLQSEFYVDTGGDNVAVKAHIQSTSDPHNVTKAQVGLADVENLKVKLDATTAPTGNNDVDEGYTVGSYWYDITADRGYVCLDNTDGAAIWKETTSLGTITFTGLTDTPANYTGEAGKYVKVNVGGDALEFGTVAGEANTASNIGFVDDATTAKIYKQKIGVDLELRVLKEGTAIDFFWIGDSGLKENNTQNDGFDDIYSPTKIGQYWTAGSSYVINNIQCLLYRKGTGNTLTMYIYAADASGYPTGDELGSIVVDCTAITTSTAGEWVTFDLLADNISITSTNKYCWYLYSSSSSSANCSSLRHMNSDVLANSHRIYYYASWAQNLTKDAAFKIYATATYENFIQIGVIPGDIKLDDLGATDDNTDLDTSTTAHGLMPKLPFSGNLLSTTTVAFNADADTTLYTVPTGKRCVLSHAIVVAAGDAGATTTVSIGQNTAETDFVPANTLSNLDAEYDAVILMPIPNTTPLKIKSYAADTVIEAQVASQSGVAGNTIYLFGILY